MDRTTGRSNHIEDYLTRLYPNQWFTWTNSKNKVYANLRLTTEYGVKGNMVSNPRSLPTEQECTDGLAQLQDDFDAQDYARKRQAEYPTVQDLVVALYDTEDKAAIDSKRAEIKLKYPKP